MTTLQYMCIIAMYVYLLRILCHVTKQLIQPTQMVAGILSTDRHDITFTGGVDSTFTDGWCEYHAVDPVARPQTRGSRHQFLRGTTWNTPSLKFLYCQLCEITPVDLLRSQHVRVLLLDAVDLHRPIADLLGGPIGML